MTGSTLVVSRDIKLYQFYKQGLEKLGFNNLHFTEKDKDGLNMFIRDLKPNLLMMDSFFYDCCTPYMVAGLHREFPKINIVVFSISKFSSRRAKDFIFNGATSYVNFFGSSGNIVERFNGLKSLKYPNLHF